jgi:hypothetical protein
LTISDRVQKDLPTYNASIYFRTNLWSIKIDAAQTRKISASSFFTLRIWSASPLTQGTSMRLCIIVCTASRNAKKSPHNFAVTNGKGKKSFSQKHVQPSNKPRSPRSERYCRLWPLSRPPSILVTNYLKSIDFVLLKKINKSTVAVAVKDVTLAGF